MLQWCSYCQRFLSEKPPFQDYSITHGICSPCSKLVRSITPQDREKMVGLSQFQKELWLLGEKRQFTEALELINSAVSRGIREVDILLGFLAPILSDNSGALAKHDSCGDEQFKQSTLRLVDTMRSKMSALKNEAPPDVLLIARSDNQHVLGIQLLEMWLCAEAISTRAFVGEDDRILAEFHKIKPKVIGFTIADKAQINPIGDLIRKIKAAVTVPPLFLIGGMAVKSGEISSADIPEASIIEDSQKLFLTIKTHLSLSFLYELKSKGA